ncbi:MAG: ATP-binding cassette domain-containing protein [Pseudonocardia sp.]|nr:ATP-binding cassette domain-containing protein [Pseudonocardia sp.]
MASNVAYRVSRGVVSGQATSLVDAAPRVRIRTIFARFWPDTKPYRGRFALSLLLVGIAPALSTAELWLFKILVDQVVVPHDFGPFPLLAGGYVALAVIHSAVSFTDQYLSVWVGERFVLTLRNRLFAHLHRLSLGFFDRHQLGDVLTRLTGDIGAIENLVLSGVSQSLSYLLQLMWFTGALFVLDWRLAVAALIAAPGFLLAARFFSRRIKNAAREKRRRAGALTSVAEESFANTALVRAYHRGREENQRFATQNLATFTAQMIATRLQALFRPLTDLLEVVGVLLVVGLAVWELAGGRITIGGVLAFVAYLTQMYGPIQGFGQLTNSLYAASASTERVIEILDETPTVTDPHRPRQLPGPRAHGAVRFDNVSFGYPDTPAPALRDIDFTAEPGQKIAVVGASGAGKSTLMRLLLRFYDPDAGAITLDGIDLTELALADLYANTAAVLQETLVFDASIADNIRWGRPDATDAELVAAAEAADAHRFITALPDGYQTRVGQRGRLLSGGQRQRLAIARAMIRDAPLLLLDEPTTGLDAESSRRVLGPLRRLMAGRTTIIISHNLLTVTDADQILFLRHGRIVGAGTHTELLASSPDYAQLYRLHQDPPHDSGPPPCNGPDAHIEFQDFLAAGSTLNLQVRRGGCLALLTDPATARSTVLAPLLAPSPGHRHPSAGTILLNGIDVRRYTGEQLHTAVATIRVDPTTPVSQRHLPLTRTLPEVLVLEEPTAGLDRHARNDLLAGLAAHTLGHTTILITQDPVVAALADHTVHLQPPSAVRQTLARQPELDRGVLDVS